MMMMAAADVPGIGCAQYADGDAADRESTQSAVQESVVIAPRRGCAASDELVPTGINRFAGSARVRADGDVHFSVLNVHPGELFAVRKSVLILIAVGRGPLGAFHDR